MPVDDVPTDDQVADLLVKEANDCSLKYSALGLDAFKSTKRPANQPKPNTRFLNNIIRGTNHHNRALQAKENAESQAKLRDLEVAEEKKRHEEERKLRKAKPGPGDTRKRMLGDIAAILGGSPKKRRTEKAGRSATSASNASGSVESGDGTRSSHRRHKNLVMKDGVDVKKEKGRRDRLAERPRASRRGHHQDESQEDGPSSPTIPKRKHQGFSSRRQSHRNSIVAKRSEHQSSSSGDSSDSDSSEETIGPVPAKAPTVRRRGRGANAATSGIDDRFAPDYDPREDVTPESEDQRKEDDEWDHAVEAFRDRQKWNQQGAERLRSAGFTEEQVDKWKKGDQKNEADVQWTTAGGLREWDRGKVVNKDGTVSLKKDSGW
ncbi:uncharacterized protein F4807DRAFT_414709 [Annulohypoxylon truncatum]|uniref:uncharacterized protein n=1 Tax=Annulohypoxylon truncatum TaxID=327061 RepID=UPI0020085297|nr:uncharacterized protein F4807DRAFT_414709 [Annulohypoxylon truncatum]KAI1212822.1 hypothetical protein F4807DRAFT_414709 [Annulohypoxylon truncatum]